MSYISGTILDKFLLNLANFQADMSKVRGYLHPPTNMLPSACFTIKTASVLRKVADPDPHILLGYGPCFSGSMAGSEGPYPKIL